jgi:hypothetical protein
LVEFKIGNSELRKVWSALVENLWKRCVKTTV